MIPLRNNILIKPVEHVVDAFDIGEKMTVEEGEVLAVGMDVQVVVKGDIIIYKNYAVDVIEIRGEQFTFIKEDDVIALS